MMMLLVPGSCNGYRQTQTQTHINVFLVDV